MSAADPKTIENAIVRRWVGQARRALVAWKTRHDAAGKDRSVHSGWAAVQLLATAGRARRMGPDKARAAFGAPIAEVEDLVQRERSALLDQVWETVRPCEWLERAKRYAETLDRPDTDWRAVGQEAVELLEDLDAAELCWVDLQDDLGNAAVADRLAECAGWVWSNAVDLLPAAEWAGGVERLCRPPEDLEPDLGETLTKYEAIADVAEEAHTIDTATVRASAADRAAIEHELVGDRCQAEPSWTDIIRDSGIQTGRGFVHGVRARAGDVELHCPNGGAFSFAGSASVADWDPTAHAATRIFYDAVLGVEVRVAEVRTERSSTESVLAVTVEVSGRHGALEGAEIRCGDGRPANAQCVMSGPKRIAWLVPAASRHQLVLKARVPALDVRLAVHRRQPPED